MDDLASDFARAWDCENDFYLSCDTTRISKILAAYELNKMVLDLPGHVIECGVFKGTSLSRFAIFRSLLGNVYLRRSSLSIFSASFREHSFRMTSRPENISFKRRERESISVEQMREGLDRRGIGQNVELVPGDITLTVPEYAKNKPELNISLLNLTRTFMSLP